ncbi:MAG: TspO/MBR family protein [Flavobacteriia bacterium]
MSKKRIPTLLFLLLNFAALAAGGLFTGNGVSSEWYQNLDKAPWTPPGWVFGAAWTLIMVCFAFYMGQLWVNASKHKGLLLRSYGLQWVLNVAWNPVFFYFQKVDIGLLVIVGLLLSVLLIAIKFSRIQKSWTLAIVPYVLWLLVATSLNAYIFFKM